MFKINLIFLVSQTEQLINDTVKLKEDKKVIQQSVDAALNEQAEIEKELNALNTQYEKVKLLIDQKQYARTKHICIRLLDNLPKFLEL